MQAVHTPLPAYAETSTVTVSLLYVNVITCKQKWIVRVANQEVCLHSFTCEPSTRKMQQSLESLFPKCDFEISFAGIFQLF